MTDTLTVDNPTTEGAGGNQPSVSGEGGKPIGGAPLSSQELLDIKRRQDLIESELRGLQSRQDKSTNEVERFMEDVKARMAKGASLEEAEQAVKKDRKDQLKDDLLFKVAEKLGVTGNSPQNVAGNNGNAADEAAKVFAKYGVDPNDPAITPFLALKGAELKAAVADYAFTKSKQAPLDSSSATSIPGGPPPPREGVDKLTEEYKKELRANVGPAKAANREAIKAKYSKMGVNIYDIDFT